jgi:exonuclease VII small subunit
MINRKDEQNAVNGAEFESVVERAETLIEKMDRIIEKLDEVIKAMEVRE